MGDPYNKDNNCLGLDWGPPIEGQYPVEVPFFESARQAEAAFPGR